MLETSIQSFLYPFSKYLISTHWVQSAVLGTGDEMGSDSDPGAQAGEDEISVSPSGCSSPDGVGGRPGSGTRVPSTGESLKSPTFLGEASHPPIQRKSQLVRQKGRPYENEGEC